MVVLDLGSFRILCPMLDSSLIGRLKINYKFSMEYLFLHSCTVVYRLYESRIDKLVFSNSNMSLYQYELHM